MGSRRGRKKMDSFTQRGTLDVSPYLTLSEVGYGLPPQHILYGVVEVGSRSPESPHTR